MSYNAESLQTVNATLEPLAPLNAQFPLLLYSHKNCTGQRYPPEGEFGLWNQDLNFDHVGFDNIVSLYVPPHALLEMWSAGDADGYYSVQGPALISDTGAYLAFWHHYDNSPCFATEKHCGKRVGSPQGWRLGVDFGRMRITWNTSWVTLLHNFASNKQTLAFGTTTYNVNNDALFDELCPHPYDRYSCNCHSAYQDILQQHFDAANSSYVNILQNGCNPNTMYVPSQAQVGNVTLQDCTTQINAQLNTGTFPAVDQGGPEFYICSGRVYVNTHTTGSTQAQARSEAGFSSSSSTSEVQGLPTYAWYVMGALLLVGVLLGLFYVLYVNRTLTTTSRRHPNLHRVRMQRAFP